MADQNMATEELLLDVRVAEASKLYKFYLNQEKKILGPHRGSFPSHLGAGRNTSS